MNDETALARREREETDQRTLETIFGMIPGNVELKDARILWDAVFYTQEAVAEMHNCCRASVNRLVKDNRAVYLELVAAKKVITADLAHSVLYSALRTLDDYLRKNPEIKDMKAFALLTQSATQLSKIVEACPEKSAHYNAQLPPMPLGMLDGEVPPGKSNA